MPPDGTTDPRAARENDTMAARIIQEMQGVENGRQQVLVRIAFDRSDAEGGIVEVTALVGVPTIDSQTQMEGAARELARQAISSARDVLP